MALAIGTVGSVGMWSFVVLLPAVQADFGVARGEASFPFTLTMVGFGIGGILMGRLADRFGVVAPILLGAFCWRWAMCSRALPPIFGSLRWRRA